MLGTDSVGNILHLLTELTHEALGGRGRGPPLYGFHSYSLRIIDGVPFLVDVGQHVLAITT